MEKVEERECVVIQNHGEKIFGVLHRPLAGSQVPAVLMCHGLAGQKTGKNRVYVALAQLLANIGIATLRIDFRGSGDSEGEFSDMTLEGQISDALAAIKFLKDHPQVDPKRVGLFGRSLGGAVALIAARREGNIKSLALWAPMFNADQWLDKWRLVQSKKLTKKQVSELMTVNGQQAGYEFFKELFKLNLEEELLCLQAIPLLHIHGEKDILVNLFHAEKYKQHRANASAESKFLRLPRSDHEFSDAPERELAVAETLSWFKRTL